MNFLKKISIFWLLIIILVFAGIVVATMRSVLRISLEKSNIYVETLADFNEFRELSRKEGWTVDELFIKLKENGASSVAISEDTLSSLELEGKISVFSSKEIRKLSLNESYEVTLPTGISALGGLWIHSDDEKLLDRIYRHLSWKYSDKSLVRSHPNLLFINKSNHGLMERVGLGFSEEYINLAEKHGLGVVLRVYNFPEMSLETASKIINEMPFPSTVSALIFADEEMFGMRSDLNKIIELFKNRSYRIGWIEFDTQEGIKNYLKILTSSYPFVRVHEITRKEMDLVYSPDRAIARWVRAVKDRSLKMLYFRCFLLDEKKYVSNLTDFNLKYLKKTVDELEKSGFKIAQSPTERLNEPRKSIGNPSFVEKIFLNISLMVGVLILLKLSFLPQINDLVLLIYVIFVLVMLFLFPEKATHISGLIGAISYSSIGYILATKSIENSSSSFIKNSFRYLFLLVIPSVCGGILIAGLYSSVDYLLKFDQFHGIKLAFIVPLIFSFTWSLKKYGKRVFALLQKPMTIISIVILLAVVVSLFLYIIRSDNTLILKPTALEDRSRTFLENTLIARPRNKEFLVGYPAALIFVAFLMRKEFALLPILAIFIQMGQVSVVNTFCHFHSPLALTMLRTANGFWLGALIGFFIVLGLSVLQLILAYGKGKQKSVFFIGYFGFGNAGDELLRETYIDKFLKEHKDFRVSVLFNCKTIKYNGKICYIPRKSIFTVLEELIKNEAVIVPGGGVFQSVTSCRSLFYYYFLIWFAQKFGAKVILPAQGLGPWNTDTMFGKWLHKNLAKLLMKSDYITVRDEASFNRYKEITSPEAYVETTTDLVFLNDKFTKIKAKSKISFMRIYAVLRSSVKGSTQIASELIKLAREIENIELVPVAFQDNEDSYVWRRADWKNEIKVVNDFENVFNDADLVVSMRLHGCIMATKQGVPWIGIAYDPKVSSFAEACGWSEFCKVPEEADTEFIEKSINELAYDYNKRSKKLLEYADKMQKISERDFQRSCDAIKKVITYVVFLFLINSVAFAENHFPEWMDEVNFEKKSSFSDFNGPVDPETGKTSTLEPKRGKGFKPKLPDFAELRKKATKVETETGSDTVIIKENTSNSTMQSLKDIPELATATKIIDAINRLASDTVASCSPNLSDEEEPSDEELKRRRTYRPGRIRSFYLESKQKQKEEAMKTEN